MPRWNRAEQQFAAAASVDVQSRPLNLFYGLSQAGRAVAASLVPADEPAQLSGHGIQCPGLAQIEKDPVSGFSNLLIRADGKPTTSFRRLSELLGSAPLGEAIALGDLWAMLVEPSLHEPLDPGRHGVHLISARRHNHDMVKVTVEGLPEGFGPADFNKLTQRYPALARMEFSQVSGSSVGQSGVPTVAAELLDRSASEPAAIGTDYRGAPVILPAISGGKSTMHPLMAWWAVLYALSILTRYHPQAWTALTNVDTSEHAVPVGYLLDVAQDAVPDLLWRTLRR
ncbi:MAG: YaaC family protein [Dermatophilaceae bacterium]